MNDRARQSVFFTPLNPIGNDPEEEEERHSAYTVPQKVHYETYWNGNQDAVYWIKLSRAQDEGLRFLQTKSLAIITYTTVPGDCIERVTFQNGDRVIFERLTEVEKATKKLVLPTSEAEADTHLTGKEALTDTNTKEMERIKIVSNKNCIREDLAKEKMVFRKESNHAIFEMGNVELIELKNHRFNVRHAFTTFSKEHSLQLW